VCPADRALAGGEPPDVFYLNDNKIPDLAKAGALEPIGDKMDNPGDFYPSLKDSFTYKGTFYSANRRGRCSQPVTTAESRDGGRTFRPRGGLLIPQPPDGCTMYRDPYVWRDGDGWRMLVGAALADGRGAALLYESPDLETWTYQGPFCAAEPEPIGGTGLLTGEGWECPQYLPAAPGRGVLMHQRVGRS
jgi:beta-fructofuranosidase